VIGTRDTVFLSTPVAVARRYMALASQACNKRIQKALIVSNKVSLRTSPGRDTHHQNPLNNPYAERSTETWPYGMD
jgi:hypothetical protein